MMIDMDENPAKLFATELHKKLQQTSHHSHLACHNRCVYLRHRDIQHHNNILQPAANIT